MKRDRKGFSFVELAAITGISATVAVGGTWAVGSLQRSADNARKPVEMGKLRIALSQYVKDFYALPDFLNPTALYRWKQYYTPPYDATTPMPFDFQYEIIRPYQNYGITSDAVPGRVRITGSQCDKYTGSSGDYCEMEIDKY